MNHLMKYTKGEGITVQKEENYEVGDIIRVISTIAVIYAYVSNIEFGDNTKTLYICTYLECY